MEIIKGYKVFNPDWTAQHDNFQYEVGKEYEMDGEITPCKRGFHFCEKLEDCFKYYIFTPYLKVAEVEGTGQIKREGNKICCSRIRIRKEIPLYEAIKLVNDGEGNLGVNNQGNDNRGDDNQGNGNRGNHNIGNDNQGNGNRGDWNQGNYNRGNGNRGDWNQGNYNRGNGNRGDWNQGDGNQGDYNQGGGNQGDSNQGDYNRGNGNRGNGNQGDGNQGDYNQGDGNQGDSNQGDYNLGDYNLGKGNIGIGNKGNYIVGLWCTRKQPFYLFNKLCSIPLDEFEQSENYELLIRLTQAENPQLEWESFTPEEKQITLSTENITPEIFKELFDIDVTEDK